MITAVKKNGTSFHQTFECVTDDGVYYEECQKNGVGLTRSFSLS